jgi:hypothetical protein
MGPLRIGLRRGRLTDMKKALIFAAIGEAANGLALLVFPSLVGQLLLGEDLTGVAVPVARVAGIALSAGPNLEQSFPASRFAFPVLGEQLP